MLVGNSLSTDGDFSSYELVTVIAGPNPGVFYWYIVKPELDRPYRYVALKRITPIGASYILEVNEIEVLIWKSKAEVKRWLSHPKIQRKL